MKFVVYREFFHEFTPRYNWINHNLLKFTAQLNRHLTLVRRSIWHKLYPWHAEQHALGLC